MQTTKNIWFTFYFFFIFYFFYFTTNNYFGKYFVMVICFYELLRLLFLAISVCI